MRRLGTGRGDKDWLKKLGKHIERLILAKGYESPYDFWVNKAGDEISRATLNFILSGKSDPKATTLRALARLLEVKPSDILGFD